MILAVCDSPEPHLPHTKSPMGSSLIRPLPYGSFRRSSPCGVWEAGATLAYAGCTYTVLLALSVRQPQWPKLCEQQLKSRQMSEWTRVRLPSLDVFQYICRRDRNNILGAPTSPLEPIFETNQTKPTSFFFFSSISNSLIKLRLIGSSEWVALPV